MLSEGPATQSAAHITRSRFHYNLTRTVCNAYDAMKILSWLQLHWYKRLNNSFPARTSNTEAPRTVSYNVWTRLWRIPAQFNYQLSRFLYPLPSYLHFLLYSCATEQYIYPMGLMSPSALPRRRFRDDMSPSQGLGWSLTHQRSRKSTMSTLLSEKYATSYNKQPMTSDVQLAIHGL